MWRTLWRFHGVIWIQITAGATLLVSAYYGFRRMTETWGWYTFKFRDKPVYFELRKRMKGHYGRGFDIPELAEAVGRDESSIRRSLVRLKDGQKAMQNASGWYGL